MTTTIPEKQHAIQLVGKSELKLNPGKDVPTPGPHQILCKVDAVGLCFSDLKLLKQFDEHPRKSEVVKGLKQLDALKDMPNYVPGDRPTVPGHEAVVHVIAVGGEVKHHKVDDRYLVQTDYRELLTAGSNAAFGYNFEGALQEYVLLDERIVIDSEGQRFLIPVPEERGASSIALVEPWACVEDSYVTEERQAIKAGGKMAIVVDAGAALDSLPTVVSPERLPAEIQAVCADDNQRAVVAGFGSPVTSVTSVADLPDKSFDDIIYFGADPATIEILSDKLGTRGIVNLVLGDRKIGRPVSIGVGRVHYGMTRWVGTTGQDAAAGYGNIPATGELRAGDNILIVGAGGPMGQMHVIRSAASGLAGLKITSTDMDDARLQAIADKVAAMNTGDVELRWVNPQKNPQGDGWTYVALMAPVGALVADAIQTCGPGCIVNIFAGIPAPVKHALDLDAYIAKRCFMFGTSGSTIRDMHLVLDKVLADRLETDLSVDAVSGMAGAIDGIAAVENRTMAGKIIVYPQLYDLPLTPLDKLGEKYPTVAAKMAGGRWNKAAEQELLRVAQ